MNPPFEMRKVVLPFEQAAEVKTQPYNLQIVLASPKGTLARINTSVVERAKTRAKADALEWTLVTEANVDIVPTSKATLVSTPIQTQIQASQDIPTTLITTNVLLLLITRPKFDRTRSEDIFESAKSLAAHIEKVPYAEPILSFAPVFPSANEIQMDLLLANQQTIMASQQ